MESKPTNKNKHPQIPKWKMLRSYLAWNNGETYWICGQRKQNNNGVITIQMFFFLFPFLSATRKWCSLKSTTYGKKALQIWPTNDEEAHLRFQLCSFLLQLFLILHNRIWIQSEKKIRSVLFNFPNFCFQFHFILGWHFRFLQTNMIQ